MLTHVRPYVRACTYMHACVIRSVCKGLDMFCLRSYLVRTEPDKKWLTQFCLLELKGDVGDVANDEVCRPADGHEEVVHRLLDARHDVHDEQRVLDVGLVRADGPVRVGEGSIDKGAVVRVVVEAGAVLDGPWLRTVDDGIPLRRGDGLAACQDRKRKVFVICSYVLRTNNATWLAKLQLFAGTCFRLAAQCMGGIWNLCTTHIRFSWIC